MIWSMSALINEWQVPGVPPSFVDASYNSQPGFHWPISLSYSPYLAAEGYVDDPGISADIAN